MAVIGFQQAMCQVRANKPTILNNVLDKFTIYVGNVAI